MHSFSVWHLQCHGADALQLAERTQHAYTISWALFANSILCLLKRDWPKASSLVENWIWTLRTGNVVMLLPWAIASSAWALAQTGDAKEALSRVRQAEQLLGNQTTSGILGHRGWAYVAVGRACLLLEPFDEARHFGKCSVESLQRQPDPLAHALYLLGDVASHPDAFDAETGAAHYRQALAIAKQHGMRPLIAHCNLGLGQLYGRMGKSEHARENLSVATTMSAHPLGARCVPCPLDI